MSRETSETPERTGSRPRPTPCIHVCEMDVASDLCRGCHRTAEEICAWPGSGTGSTFGGGSVFGGPR